MPRPAIPPAPAAVIERPSAPKKQVVLPSASQAQGKEVRQFEGTANEAIRCLRILQTRTNQNLRNLEQLSLSKPTQTQAEVDAMDQLSTLSSNVSHAAKSMAMLLGLAMTERFDTHKPQPGRQTTTPRHELALALLVLDEEDDDLHALNDAAVHVSWACQMAQKWTLDGTIAASFSPTVTR